MKLLLLLLWLANSIDGHCAEGVEDILRKTAASREQELAPLRETLAAAQKIEDLDAASKYASRLEGELAKLPPALQATQPAAEASHFLGSLHTRLAERAARANQWNQARQEALLALKFDSGQTQAEKVRQQAGEMLRRGAGAKGDLNSALSDSFFAKLEAVRAGLERGEALRETGQLEKADRAFQEVLKMDPFNEAAVAGLAKIHEEKLLVSEKRRDTAFQQKKQEVRSLFSNLREVEPSASDSRSSGGGGLAKGPAEMINSRLEAIRIPEVNFPGLDLESLRRALNALAAQYDPNPPQGKPISFFISPELAEKETAPISLRLRNATLGDIIRYASQVANIKARFDGRGVILGPLVEEGEIILRSFPRVSPSFFAAETKTSAEEGPAKIRGGTGLTSRLGGTPDGGQVGAQEYLQKLGVDFTNPKSFAVYNTSTKTLKVANTPEMCDLVGNLIAAAQEDTLLIRIDCRLVEINQTDLDSLTVNTTVGSQQSELFNVFPQGLIPSSTGSTPTPSAQQGVTMQLNQIQGVGLLPNNTLQSFLAPGVLAGPNQVSSYDLNTMQLGGSIMGGTQFRTFITAISQKSSANVLASPTLVLKRGQKGTIEVSQEFRFVQEYNDPQSSIRTFIPFGGAAGIGGFVTPIPGPETVISAFPSQISDPEPIGVKMGVKPDVTGENTRVLLELEPTFVDFEGFINYGAVVNSAYAATYFGDATTILTNNIQQPVFVRRDLVIPPVEVKDGHTLTLGGLLREDIQTIDEKVPIFGDIPLLGRAFQGKTEQAIKKNTLIFVTPRILRTDGAPLNPTAGAEDAASTMDDLVYASPPPPAAN
jgi:general secretion pathway protein D